MCDRETRVGKNIRPHRYTVQDRLPLLVLTSRGEGPDPGPFVDVYWEGHGRGRCLLPLRSYLLPSRSPTLTLRPSDELLLSVWSVLWTKTEILGLYFNITHTVP